MEQRVPKAELNFQTHTTANQTQPNSTNPLGKDSYTNSIQQAEIVMGETGSTSEPDANQNW